MKIHTLAFVALALVGCGGAGSSSTLTRPTGSYYGSFSAHTPTPDSGTADVTLSASGQLTGTLSDGSLSGTVSDGGKLAGSCSFGGNSYTLGGYETANGADLDISGYVVDSTGQTWSLLFDLVKQ